MKKLVLLVAVAIFSVFSCQKNEGSLIEENGESLIVNPQNRAGNRLDIGELVDVSTLVDVYTSPEYHVDYKLYDAPQTFLTTLTPRGSRVESITVYDDCHNGDFGLGVYIYSTLTKNLTYNYYRNLQRFVDNQPDEIKTVNDILIDDVMYERNMKYPGCAVSVFYSDQWQQGSYAQNYNDMRLEEALVPADEFEDEGAACGWTPNCLRDSGNQCRGHSCANITCGMRSFQTSLVEREYPNYLYYVSEVIKENEYYKLRDDFLDKSTLGKKYTRVFYQIQDHLMETMDMRLTGKILGVLPSINRSIDHILDPSYHGVIVDGDLQRKMTEVIDISINNSTSDLYKITLLQLQRDLNSIANLNKSGVNRYFDLQ